MLEKKPSLRLLTSFFFSTSSKIIVFACNHDQSFFNMKKHNMLCGLSCEKC